jgi:hypothetical protein
VLRAHHIHALRVEGVRVGAFDLDHVILGRKGLIDADRRQRFGEFFSGLTSVSPSLRCTP